ncbi:Ig-like domain-containing protein [Bacillus sp. sid0103]|uniref:Ig-like domain-containing protein n=1 Tax=Bacillus sp. sid0103 TaxID=2856337 RepID=UPI0035B457F8
MTSGNDHVVGLKKDGTVVTTGNGSAGQRNTGDWKGIVDIAAGMDFTVGLKSDGTVVGVGNNPYGQVSLESWKNIKDISANEYQTVGLRNDGTIINSNNYTYPNEVIHPQININKNVIKPNDNLKITFSKDKYYKLTDPGISLSGGITLPDGKFEEVNDLDYEFNYIVKPTDSGIVNVSVPGITDFYGNSLVKNDYFRVIPLQSIKTSKSLVSSGDKVTITATFYESVKPGFQLSLGGAVDLKPTSMTEVAGSNGTKFILSYTIPYNYKEGTIHASLKNVETVSGVFFNRYTEQNVFTKQNRLAPISSLTASKEKAKIGDVVTVTANFMESIKNGVQLSFDGAGEMEPVVMSEVAGSNGTKYTYDYTVLEGFTGNINAHLKEVYDQNNKLSQEFVSNNLFMVDGIRSSLKSLTASTASAKLGDKVLLTAVFDEPIKPNFTLSLNNGVNLQNVSMNEVEDSNSTIFNYEYVVKEGDLGSIHANIEGIEDLAGNISPAYSKDDVFHTDGINPAILSVESEEKEYEVGDYAHIIATFTEPVKPGVKLKLSGGIDNEEYTMSEVQGSNGLEYEIYYEIKEGQHGVVYGLLSNIVDLAGNEVTYDQKKIFYASDPSNANLASITVSDGSNSHPLTPGFSSEMDTYSVYLPSNVTCIFLSGESQDSKATVEGSGLKNLVQGENTFILKITASNLNTKYYRVIINVTDDTKPEITGVVDQTVGMNTPFDAMDGVKATDNVDGDLTSLIMVEGFVDISKPGVYKLKYTITDKAGNSSTIKRNITVVDNIPPAKPIVDSFGDNQNMITGTAEENGYVVAEVNGSQIGSSPVGNGGLFGIWVNKQSAGTKINLYVIDAYGNSGQATTIEVLDISAPEKPQPNKVTDKDSIVTGQGEAGTAIKVKVNGSEIGSGTVEEDSSFTVAIPVQKAGTELAISATDKAGNESETTTLVVEDVTAPEMPVVNEITDKDTAVTGEAETGSKVEVNVNGLVIGTGTAGEDGQFNVTIPSQTAGMVLNITATDNAGNMSSSSTIVVKDGTAPLAPIVENVSDISRMVWGKSEVGSIVTVTIGQSQYTTIAEYPFGDYEVTIPAQKEGTVIEVTATDSAGNISDARKVIVQDGTPPAAPIVNEINDQSSEVSGTTEAGAKVYVVYTSPQYGVLVSTGYADENGNYQVMIPVQSAGSTIQVIAADSMGNQSEPTNIVVKDATAPNTPQVNEVTDKSQEVSGTSEAGAKVTVRVGLIEYGLTEYTGKADENGNFLVSIPAQHAGTEITVFVTDESGNVSESNKVIVKDVTAPNAPEIVVVTDKDTKVTGKAEAGSKVQVKVENSVLGTGTVGVDGKFNINIPVQKAGTEIKFISTDKAGNVSETTTVVVKDVTAPGKPEVNEVTDKDTIVTGQAEAGSKVEVKVNGSVIGTGTAGEDGQYKVAISAQKAGTELVIVAMDQAGNVSEPTAVVVKDVTAPEKPAVNEVTDKDTSVTGQAEAGSKVEVKVNGSVIGTGTAGEDGRYEVTIPVQQAGIELVIISTDKAGNVSEETAVVVKDVTAPEKPEVNEVTDKDTSVTGKAEAGSKVDVKVNGSVIGTGTAGEDGQYRVTISGQKAGTELVIIATDKAGNVSERTTVVVRDVTAPEKPEVKEVTDKDTTVTGQAETGSKVEVKVNGSVIGSGTVGEDGQYKVIISAQKAGTELVISATDKAGNVSETTTAVVRDVTAPEKPVVYEVTDKGTTVTGQTEAGSKVEVKVNGSVIGTGTAGEDGQYKVTIDVQKAGTELEIVAMDKAGNVSETTTVVVKDVTAPDKPEVNEVTDKDTTVTGQAEARSKVEVKVNGSDIGSGTAGEDGQYKVTIEVQKAGTELVIVATDKAGNVSETTTVVVRDVTAPEKPVVNEVTDKDTTVTGQAEAGSKVEVKVNGSVIGEGTAGEDGQFTVTISEQKAGTELVIVATDKAGNVSETSTVVIRDATAPEQPVVNEVTDKDTSVTGQAEAGSKVEVKVNGSVIGTGTAGEDGQYKVSIDVQKAGTELEIVATDKAGNVSETTTVMVRDVSGPEKPIVNEVTDKDTTVTGQAEAGSKVEVKANGSVIGEGTAGEDGQYNVIISSQKAGTELVIIATDKAGNVSETTTVVVRDVTAPEKPEVNEVTDKDTTVTGQGEAGSKVEVKVNGSVIGTGTAEEDGQYKVTIDVQKAGTELVIIATDNSGNVSEETAVVVKDVTAPKKPVVSLVSDRDTTITGEAEAGSKIEVKVNGSVIGTGTAGQDGKYKVTIRVQKAGTVLVIIATDAAGNESEGTTIKVIDKTAPSVLTVNTVSDKSKEVTGKTEAGATVSILIGTKTYAAKADPNGNFKVIIPILKAGTKLIVTAKDAAGNASVAKSITVIDKTPPVAPTVTTVTDLAKLVTGKAEAGAIVTVTIGTKKYIAKADAKGNYKVTIPVQKAGTKVIVTVKDAAGNVSVAKSVIVIDKTAPLAPKIKTTVKSTTKEVTGTAEAYSTITIKVGSKVIGTAEADSKGNFKVKIKAQKKKTVLSVTATDKAKNVSKAAIVVKVK